jgi:hypothetical protein
MVVAAFVTVILVFAAVFLLFIHDYGPYETPSRPLAFRIGSEGYNWTLTVTYGPTEFKPSDLFMTIYDANGSVRPPMSSIRLTALTSDNWMTYRMTYQKLSAGTFIDIGDKILADKSTYPSSNRFEIRDSSSILATGTLQ